MTRHAQPIWMTAALALAACGDDAKTPSDTTTGDTAGDTSPNDTTLPNDTHQPGDVIDPGKTLAGTPLDGITVVWPSEPLVLCNAWQEGATREAELAHKVRVTIPAQTRAGLEQADLASAQLVGAVVETGPFAGESWRPAVNSATTLVTWTMAGANDDALVASVAFDLGDAGTLTESYYVWRTANADGPTPVEVANEVQFGWVPKDSTDGRTLEPCEGREEDAIAVLSASNPALAAKHTTLVRFYKTTHSDFGAGSYPVQLWAWQTIFSDSSWMLYQARGPWALTYVAQHHNWQEDSVIDYRRDLGGHQTITQALANDEPIFPGAVTKVQLDDVGGSSDPGTVTVTRMNDGVEGTSTYTANGAWKRVDRAYLTRSLDSPCSAGSAGADGYGDTVAMLVWCPDATGPGGKSLVGVVPVLWQLAPEVIGTPVEKITAITGGWRVSIGDSTMDITPQGTGFLTTVRDGDGVELTSAYTDPYDLTPYAGWGGDITAEADDVRVHIVRRWAAQGIGESAIYGAESMRLEAGDDVWFVDAWDRIDYVNTHHNWNDTLDATTDDGTVIHWKIVYDFENGLIQTVWVTGPDGDEQLAPTVVTPKTTTEE